MKTSRRKDIAGKVALQRLQRESKIRESKMKVEPVHPVEKFKSSTPKKKEDIADKVARQRRAKERAVKKSTGAEGKDPKTVRSRKGPRFN